MILPPVGREAVEGRRAEKDTLGVIFVETPEALAFFSAFDELLAETATATNGKGIAVLGPTRCGKTSLVAEYVRRCRIGYVEGEAAPGTKRRPLKVLKVHLQSDTRLSV